ncbi:hypothetical protein FSARC_10695 [Fusarium sarcochroum]|uniref:RTA1 like protein n=1 Tax=Fusarium sarcochroum TaxID=1208366 RepID=A0A8H4X3G5_9HYPO|nr:hypothetical protein FSARC_10695 [Fusarium sarcochroum]
MAELKPYKGHYYLWQYVPNQAAAVIFVVLFLLGTAAITFRMVQTRTWFTCVFVIGGLFEIIGYGARAGAHDKTERMMPYVIQNTYILLAPALFAAAIYMCLGRIIRQTQGESRSIVPVRWLAKIFVSGDVISFLVQGGAAGLMATGDNAKLGENMVVCGLMIQILVFGFFIITTIIFQMRMRKAPTALSQDPSNEWTRDIYMLYVSSPWVAMGAEGYLLKHEWLYIFDSTLMLLVVGIFYWRYPALYYQKKHLDDDVIQLRSNP